MHAKWPFHSPILRNPKNYMPSRVMTIFTVSLISRLFLALSQKSVRMEGLDNITKRGIDRMPERPLITVSTHTATIDDAVMWPILPMKYWGLDPDKFRWVLGAQELTYDYHPWAFLLFSRGQIIPIVRGKGIYQDGMEAALEILNQGGWIHIFSEGRVYPQPPMGVNMPLRWGIARLILECNIEPIVIPVIHKGVDRIKKLNDSRLGLWNDILVRYGEPIPFIGEARSSLNAASDTDRSKLTESIANVLVALYNNKPS